MFLHSFTHRQPVRQSNRQLHRHLPLTPFSLKACTNNSLHRVDGIKREVCEWNKVGKDTWEPKHVSAWSANWLIADADPAEYLKNQSRRLGKGGSELGCKKTLKMESGKMKRDN